MTLSSRIKSFCNLIAACSCTAKQLVSFPLTLKAAAGVLDIVHVYILEARPSLCMSRCDVSGESLRGYANLMQFSWSFVFKYFLI